MLTYDDAHHKFVGDDPLDSLCVPCEVCGRHEDDTIHQSAEEFAREVDEVFGR